MGVSISETPTVDFLSQGLTEDQGEVSYPHTTFGKGMYKQTTPITLNNETTYYIKITHTDKNDSHPLSVKLKVESTHADTTTGRTVEEATINVT